MTKNLAITGGIIVIVSVILTLFTGFFGWYNFRFTIPVNWSTYLNAFGGYGDTGKFSESFTEVVPGILVLIGGILFVTQNKTASLIGGVLVFLGLVLFLINLGTSEPLASLIDTLDANFIYTDNALYGMHVGIGWIITLIGGILGTVGGVKEE